MLVAWIVGGYWYVHFYPADKALILKGPWPFAHNILMEAKEHLFFLTLILAFCLPIAVWDKLYANPNARKMLLRRHPPLHSPCPADHLLELSLLELSQNRVHCQKGNRVQTSPILFFPRGMSLECERRIQMMANPAPTEQWPASETPCCIARLFFTPLCGSFPTKCSQDCLSLGVHSISPETFVGIDQLARNLLMTARM
jgi:hypothetical protein